MEVGEQVYTDTETLFLPAVINRFSDRDANFQVYKVMVVHLWAQTWYGTWHENVPAQLSKYAEYEKALACFHALETLRLDALIERTLPGVYRQLVTLHTGHELPDELEWQQAKAVLSTAKASVRDSLTLVDKLIDRQPADVMPYQGVLKPLQVAKVREARLEADKQAFRLGLLRMNQELEKASAEESVEDNESELLADEEQKNFSLRKIESEQTAEGFTYEIELDGRPMPVPDNIKGTMASILQDLGEIPEDYLQAAGDGAYFTGETGERSAEDVWKGTYHEEGAFIYNEWDYERQNYRKNWAVLRELDVHPKHDNFVDKTLHKYRGLAMELRRTFEALRGEDKLLKKQPHGDDIDIDALVEAVADTHNGEEMTERVFT
ncbi:Rubisco activation protein CbbO, partial [hydrothermal vent metagenome]